MITPALAGRGEEWGKEEPKDIPVTLIPGLAALLTSSLFLPTLPGVFTHHHPHPPLQASLTDAQLQGDMIGGLI